MTNESELSFTVISNTTLQSSSTIFTLQRWVKLQNHQEISTLSISTCHRQQEEILSIVILNLKIVFDKQICYENRIKILRFKLIKGF